MNDRSVVSEGSDEIGTGGGPQVALDELSLLQALDDFEIANARVLDLTQRLTSMSREFREVRTELTAVKLNHASCKARLKGSEAESAEVIALRDKLNQVRASRAVLVARFFSRKLRMVLK